MENWRKRSTSPDRPENSPNSRPSTSSTRNKCLQRYQTPNFQNPTSSCTSSNAGTRNYGLQSGRWGNYWQLQKLIKLNKKNSSEIIIELSNKLLDFGQLLASNLEPDWIVLVIAILSKVCSSYFRETKLSVLKVAINEIFLKTLEKYVKILKDQHGENPDEFIVNLLFVCESLIEIIPTSYCDILHNLLTVIESFLCPDVEERQETYTNIKILMEKLNLRKEHPEQEIGLLRVYPTFEEILTPNCELSRKNFVEEKYGNVKHYLDAHVRLWKEHFASALRQDIVQFIEHAQDPMKCPPTKMFSDIVFKSMVFSCEEFGVVVRFSNKEDSEQIFSPRSKCFDWGTVVCFTCDNFSTILLGSVITKDYEQNHLIIGFEPECNIYGSNVPYTMVQCNVYLYRYHYILQALKCMSPLNFPLKSYLIDGVPKMESPGYLDSTSSIRLSHGSRVDVFGSDWPSAEQLNLDSTQYSAFKAALTQKFVLIQGAPGTGKTYLGLQIVKTLLHEDNQRLWYNEAPILIVCLSNQVLDQFLEGLLTTTNRIIRVGKQSKNDKLADFTLKSARTRSYQDRHVLIPWIHKQKKLLKQLEVYFDCLNQINDFNYILDFSNFESIDEEIKTSWFSRASKAEIIAWLFDKQNQNLHSMEISEVVKNVMEEQKKIGQQRNISDVRALAMLWSKSHTWIEIVRIKNEVEKMEPGTSNRTNKQKKLETQLKYLWTNYQYFKMKQNERMSALTDVSKLINVDYNSPHSMNPNDRWSLYFHWLNLYGHFVEKKFLGLQHEHQKLSQNFTEIQNMLDLKIMKGALVLGMTLTAASRLQTTLQSLKCRIVVVEEACKAPESHITVSLTNHCDNLILMDTHQELCRAIGKTGISVGINMMERMMRNGMECHILSVQHRIRPKMIELLALQNYPELESHNTVTNIPPILGIPSCYYFIHHEHQDLEKYNSKVNLYEAKFLVNLARYLRQVGYHAKDISILATYSGQSEVLRDECENHEDLLNGVQVGTLGNYPSEESNIVLLSLVRNNAEGKIGRLEFEDFVNFALSRAKEALYMMGNIDLLSENSKTWARIKDVLVKQDCVGNYLPVCCTVNPDHVTQIKELEDFDGVPEKVCSKICGTLLNCGHPCSESCHFLEDDHISTLCTELCSK